jgi:hypothetical protein
MAEHPTPLPPSLAEPALVELALLQSHGAVNAPAIAAAALRAAADQVLAAQWKGRIQPDAAHSLGINWTRDALHAIAAELENQ